MDIIAAHQQGLIEQLEEDARALSGRPCDHVQRAIVLHHLFDHSRGSHQWALAEARRELRIARALAALERRIDRWGWLFPAREAARTAFKVLKEALGKDSQARCAATYGAYRLSAAPSLRGEADMRLPAELLEALHHCHGARRSGEAVADIARQELWDCSEGLAATATDQDALAAAWMAMDATGFGRIARRLLGERALQRSIARDRKRGWRRVERELRSDLALPAAFRANPAQHFYALQFALAQRRRQKWREECDREPDAFELAA